MGLQTVINGYTAWGNVRLVKSDCETSDVVKGIMQGTRMKVLLQELAGTVPKGLESMDKLSSAQKSTRVNWFVDTLKKHDKLPKSTKVDSTNFSLCSPPDVLHVLRLLVHADITALWEVAQVFHKKKVTPQVVIARPLKSGPWRVTKAEKKKIENFYATKQGGSLSDPYMRKASEVFIIDASGLLLELVNHQLKQTLEGRRLRVKSLEELVDSRVLCALVNALVPNTFTSEVLLNDRWTINLALDSASEIFRVTSPVDSHVLYQCEEEGVCAFLTYFIMCGYQYRQACAVAQRTRELKVLLEELKTELETQKAASKVVQKKVDSLERKISSKNKELSWIENVYDYEECKAWMEHVEAVQSKIRTKIAQKMTERFDILTVTRPTTINELCDCLVINLSLTGGNGFYLSSGKEKLWPDRKLVIYDKKTGEYFEDFSGRENTRGSVRKMLAVADSDIIQVTPDHYTDYEIYFESPTRNRILKGGTKFLYQVFPGTAGQCERLLLRAAHAGDITTIQKLVVFFRDNKDFVNCQDHETGNSALHLASRQGNFDITLHLLESGANVNLQNNAGNTPLFLAIEVLHRQLSQLLLEWGADIHIKNRISKTAMDLIRNMDMKEFLEGKFTEYGELTQKLAKDRDLESLETILKDHESKKNCLASLRSRCVGGDTLFHLAASLGSEFGVKLYLSKHVDTNILNVNHATPLHKARNPTVIQNVLEHGADVNAVDENGDTPLHLLCDDETSNPSTLPDAIKILVSNSAQLDIPNNKGWLPIHCAAARGSVGAIETLIELDKERVLDFLKEEDVNILYAEDEVSCPSLVYVSLLQYHLQCALWLSSKGYGMKKELADELLLKILNSPSPEFIDVVDVVGFLLAQGADPDAQYADNNRPLHLLGPLVHLPELGELLLDVGASVDARNSSLATPLCSACKANNLFLAKILIDKGADCHAVDLKGKRPFDYVQDHQEWIDSGHFSDETRALLKAFSLRQAKAMVQSISNVVQTKSIK